MDQLLASLRAAAEPTRLRLLALAGRGAFCVLEVTEILGQSQPRLSRHLKLLCECGLLDRVREGTNVWFALPTGSDGDLALFDFTGALPRAKLYANWQVNTNDQAVLKTLSNLNFDPAQTVLVSTPQNHLPATATNENSGTVEFKSYAPKHLVLAAQSATPSVLLLNDHFDPNWRVTVDGQPAELLRCNYLMRGVYLPAGAHTVEFQFSLLNKPLYVTLSAIGIGILLCGFLFVSERRRSQSSN